jgi:transcriptional regulator with XRE-family HTH domain
MYSGKDLKKLRESLKLSQQTLSNLLGVSMQTIWRWEHDDPPRVGGLGDILKIIPILQSGETPDWCAVTKKSHADVGLLTAHVGGCDRCKTVLQYLNLKAK